MSKNHPACNTPLVRALRQHFKGNPARWKEIYTNLKVVYDLTPSASFNTTQIDMAFTWNVTPQGDRYWRDIHRERLFFRNN